MAVFGQNCCIRANVVVFGPKWLCSDKSGCYRAKVVLLGQSDVFGQGGCIRGKVVVFGQKCLYSDKGILFGQMWL